MYYKHIINCCAACVCIRVSWCLFTFKLIGVCRCRILFFTFSFSLGRARVCLCLRGNEQKKALNLIRTGWVMKKKKRKMHWIWQNNGTNYIFAKIAWNFRCVHAIPTVSLHSFASNMAREHPWAHFVLCSLILSFISFISFFPSPRSSLFFFSICRLCNNDDCDDDNSGGTNKKTIVILFRSHCFDAEQ